MQSAKHFRFSAIVAASISTIKLQQSYGREGDTYLPGLLDMVGLRIKELERFAARFDCSLTQEEEKSGGVLTIY